MSSENTPTQPGSGHGGNRDNSGGSRRNRRKNGAPGPKNGSRAESRSENTTPKPENRTKNSDKGKPKRPKAKGKDPKNDYRYLEVVKLIKCFQPVTINGIPTTRILEELEKEYQENVITEAEKTASSAENDETRASAEAKITETTLPKKPSSKHFLGDYLLRLLTHLLEQTLYLSFKIEPSDPDFPFDVEVLKFNLSIPPGYPHNANSLPTIIVLNDDIPKGFAVNIEIGFKEITALTQGVRTVLEGPDAQTEEPMKLVEGKGLLSQVKTLDRYLERFLKQEKRQTIKFIKFGKGGSSTPASPSPTPSPAPTVVPKAPSSGPKKHASPANMTRRNQLLEELLSKLSPQTIKLFNKSSVESKYKIIAPFKTSRYDTPILWDKYNNSTVEVYLHVPINYPADRARLSIPNTFSSNIFTKHKDSIQGDLAAIASATKKCEKNLVSNFALHNFSDDSLVHVVNWLVNRLDVLMCMNGQEFERWNKNMRLLDQAV